MRLTQGKMSCDRDGVVGTSEYLSIQCSVLCRALPPSSVAMVTAFSRIATALGPAPPLEPARSLAAEPGGGVDMKRRLSRLTNARGSYGPGPYPLGTYAPRPIAALSSTSIS